MITVHKKTFLLISLFAGAMTLVLGINFLTRDELPTLGVIRQYHFWLALIFELLLVVSFVAVTTVIYSLKLGKVRADMQSELETRKAAEQMLKESEGKYRELVQNANSIILHLDENGNIKFFNEFAQKFFGYEEKEILGKNVVGTIIPKKDEEGMKEIISDIIRYPERYEFNENENVKKSGEPVWVAWTNKVHVNPGGGGKEIFCVGTDITERKLAEDKLQEAINMKSEFTSIVSHELRTPLMAIQESVALVAEGTTGPINPQQKEMLEIASRDIQRLNELVNDILDYEKIGSGKMEFRFEGGDLNGAVREIAQTMLPVVQKKKLALNLQLSENLPSVKFDRNKIIQVLANLVNNAIKFTEEGSITVKTVIQENGVCVSVQDTGSGIKKEHFHKLFQTFSQIRDGERKKIKGTGLGLAICRQIIEHHQGRIWLESEEGKGSSFSFLLPFD